MKKKKWRDYEIQLKDIQIANLKEKVSKLEAALRANEIIEALRTDKPRKYQEIGEPSIQTASDKPKPKPQTKHDRKIHQWLMSSTNPRDKTRIEVDVNHLIKN